MQTTLLLWVCVCVCFGGVIHWIIVHRMMLCTAPQLVSGADGVQVCIPVLWNSSTWCTLLHMKETLVCRRSGLLTFQRTQFSLFRSQKLALLSTRRAKTPPLGVVSHSSVPCNMPHKKNITCTISTITLAHLFSHNSTAFIT